MDDNQPDALEIHSPGGWWAKLVGSTTVQLFINALGFALVAWLVHNHEQEAAKTMTAFMKMQAGVATKEDRDTSERQNQLLNNQVKILQGLNASLEELRNQTYVMTLSEAEKKQLNLREPQSLTERRRAR